MLVVFLLQAFWSFCIASCVTHLYCIFSRRLSNANIADVDRVPDLAQEIYLYPDIVVTNPSNEVVKEYGNYIIHQPTLIAEVLSDSTRKCGSADNFIQYQKKSSLRYYLSVEPEMHLIIFCQKDDQGRMLIKAV
ncbi:MAG: Uma2 family endonuclease [Segetibacter sp.]|nr:Uma2 family endonuclease [Segetibacter sp.]